jgi:hypothetical protein
VGQGVASNCSWGGHWWRSPGRPQPSATRPAAAALLCLTSLTSPFSTQQPPHSQALPSVLHWPPLQELANDPLGILRPASKLQHQLPLASAYAAVAAAPDNDHGMQRQKRRLDPVTGEPRWVPAAACLLACCWGALLLGPLAVALSATFSTLTVQRLTLAPAPCDPHGERMPQLSFLCTLRVHHPARPHPPTKPTDQPNPQPCPPGRPPSHVPPAPRRFTNITRDFRGTLDYVLYTTDSLVPAAALELPDDSECRTKSHAGGWLGGWVGGWYWGGWLAGWVGGWAREGCCCRPGGVVFLGIGEQELMGGGAVSC